MLPTAQQSLNLQIICSKWRVEEMFCVWNALEYGPFPASRCSEGKSCLAGAKGFVFEGLQ